MGLDLYHAVPSAKTDETLSYLTLDSLPERPDFIGRYKHLITEVPDADHLFEILVFPNAEIKMLYLAHHPNGQDEKDKRVLVGHLPNLANELRQLELDYKLDPASRFVHSETDYPLSEKYGQGIFFLSVSYSFEGQTRQVIHWATKGYQRKGMNGYFYNDFENDKLYFDKATVIKASRYLSPPSIYGERLKMHFQENFIDNFMEGESFFFANW
jgi:hypothetical protein